MDLTHGLQTEVQESTVVYINARVHTHVRKQTSLHLFDVNRERPVSQSADAESSSTRQTMRNNRNSPDQQKTVQTSTNR